MNHRIFTPLASLILVIGLALPASGQIGMDPVTGAAFSLSPNPAPENMAFALKVSGREFDCNSRFSHPKVQVQDGQIDLSFVTTRIDPKLPCPLILPPEPYGPKFDMPALKEGKYQVILHRLLPCHVVEPMCKAAILEDSAGVLIVGRNGKVTYLIDPKQVKASADFTLNLLSFQFNCGTTYERTAAVVAGDRVTLTFLDKAHPEVICPAVYKPYGPAYKMAGLKPGVYKVYATRLPACIEQGCKILPIPEFVDNLVVGDSPDPSKGWYLKEDMVKPNVKFTMQLLNNAYGNCNTAFTHPAVQASGDAIYTSFSIENHPEHVCIVDIRPWGPIFEMSPLKPGRYPVYHSVMPACVWENPSCLPYIKIAPQLTDTLVVSAATAGLIKTGHIAPSASFHGNRISVVLPEGFGGAWQAELLDLSGKRLQTLRMEGEGGRSAQARVAGKLERGLYLVRLQAPGRKASLVQLPVGE